jgi:hypothetical protein
MCVSVSPFGWCVAFIRQVCTFLINAPDVFCLFGAAATSIRNANSRVIHRCKGHFKTYIIPFESLKCCL